MRGSVCAGPRTMQRIIHSHFSGQALPASCHFWTTSPRRAVVCASTSAVLESSMSHLQTPAKPELCIPVRRHHDQWPRRAVAWGPRPA